MPKNRQCRYLTGPLAVLQGKEVEYSLRAIPLGGYVAFPDDDPESKFEPDDPDLLRNRSIPERALVISAGVLANIAFAYSLLLTQARAHTPRCCFFCSACTAVPGPALRRMHPMPASGNIVLH